MGETESQDTPVRELDTQSEDVEVKLTFGDPSCEFAKRLLTRLVSMVSRSRW